MVRVLSVTGLLLLGFGITGAAMEFQRHVRSSSIADLALTDEAFGLGLGECEEGAEVFPKDEEACKKNAQVCSVTYLDIPVTIQVGASGSSVGFTYTFQIPNGCDENDQQKPLCPGKPEFFLEGSGTAKKIERKSCDTDQLKKYLCHEVNITGWCFDVPGTGTIEQWIEAGADLLPGVADVNGRICITGGFKKCQAYSPSDYFCGTTMSQVEQCP